MSGIWAFELDGKGGATPFDPEMRTAASLANRASGFVWLHFDRPEEAEEDWLHHLGLPPLVVGALDAPDTRPRCFLYDDGVLLNLRGVNLAEGAEPEDMVSLRFWITERLVITLQRRRVFAVEDVRAACQRKSAPLDAGELTARLALRLADRAEEIVGSLNERLDDLEEALLDEDPLPMRGELGAVRREAIILRRFMHPERDALAHLHIEAISWLTENSRAYLREATERVTRLTEALDAIRDRAEVVHDQIMDMRSEVQNRQMLVLAVVTAIFLPLSLITGLLGINVGGIPGTHDALAFWKVCGILLGIGGVLLWLFKRWDLI